MAVTSGVLCYTSEMTRVTSSGSRLAQSPALRAAYRRALARRQHRLEQPRRGVAAGPPASRPLEATAAEGEWQTIFDAIPDGVIVNDIETGLVVAANPAAVAMHGYRREEFIGLHPMVYLHPDSHPLIRNYVRAGQEGTTFHTRAVHRRRDNSRFDIELHGSALVYQERPCMLGVFREISLRVEDGQRLDHQLDAREQSTLLEIVHTLFSDLELEPVLILDQLQVMVEYTQGALFGLEDGAFVALAARGSQPLQEAVPFHVWPDGAGSLAQLLNERNPARLANVCDDDNSLARVLRSTLHGQGALLLEDARAAMWVPLIVKDTVTGGILLTQSGEDCFTAHQATLAGTIASHAAVALDNARRYAQAETQATLEERQRLAQNLHDAVNQSLFAAGLIAEVLPRLWEQDPAEARESLEDLRRLTRGALAEMRGLLVELQPLALTDTDLDDLLRQLSNALTGRTNIPVDLTVEGEGTLPPDVQVALYRLCQEALNNIARHAEPTAVSIQLCYEAGAVDIKMRDDGRGFDPESTPPGHFGLEIMRERAAAIGASLSVISQPGHGTEVAIHWVHDAPTREDP